MLDPKPACCLGDLISIKHGYAFESEYYSSEGPYVLLTPGNFWEGGGFRCLDSKQKFFCGPVPPEFVLRPDDMLVAMTEQAPGLLGSTLFVPDDRIYIHNQRLGLIRLKDKTRLCEKYLHYFLSLPTIRRRISTESAGTKVKHTSPERLYGIELSPPPLPEQYKIAKILRTWDQAIEKLEALRAPKAQQLEGFAARLIHGVQAEPQHLREHLNEVSERNRGENVERVLSVTNSAGFVLAEDQFAHRVASADISNYKIVRQGQYAYNPSRINVGSVARLDDWPEGALSPMYVVFEVRDTLDTDYFGHWLRSGEARKRIALAAQGSVRDTVSFGDLGSILVPLPSLEEQRRIARALSTAKKELTLLDEELETFTRQKRGLMQKLLTGQWRVKVEAN